MKAFIAGIITLSILIGAVIANGIFISQRTDELLRELSLLSEDVKNADSIDFSREWDTWRPFISLTVHREAVDDIDDTLELMELYIGTENSAGYLSSKKKLHCTIERLRKTESFSLSRIF